jgi:hypothetical protein
MEYDNPAERLLTIIRSCKAIPANTMCRQAWVQVLKTGNDNALLMSRLGKVMELPRIAVEALNDHFPSRASTWSHWTSQVNNAFMNQNLHAEWSSFINCIDDHSINYLQLSSDLLHHVTTTKLVASDELAAIREKLNALYEEVLGATIDEEVKKYSVRYIRKLLVSLDEYCITGALPILEAVETMVGHAFIDKNYKSFMKDTDLGQQILDSISAMANLVTVAVGLPILSQAATSIKLLGGG